MLTINCTQAIDEKQGISQTNHTEVIIFTQKSQPPVVLDLRRDSAGYRHFSAFLTRISGRFRILSSRIITSLI